MAAAAHPADQLKILTLNNYKYKYEINKDSTKLEFYFDMENNTFYCEGIIESSNCRMVGEFELKDASSNIYLCTPSWGNSFANEKSNEWENANGLEVKEMVIGEEEIEFESFIMKLLEVKA